MLVCIQLLNDRYQRLLSLQSKIEKEMEILQKRQDREVAGKINRDRQDLDFEKVKKDFSNIFTDITLAIEETKKMKPESTYRLAGAQSSLSILYNRIDNLTSYRDIDNLILTITALLKGFSEDRLYEYTQYSYTYSYASKHGEFGLGIIATNSDISKFKQAISWKQQPLNILEISAQYGEAAKSLKQEISDVEIYGVDPLKTVRDNRRYYKRLISGSLKGSVISQEVFDIVACCPKISLEEIKVRGVNVRFEKETLVRATDYLRSGGIILFGIPYYRMYRDICEYIAKTFEQVQLFKSSETADGTVFIMGKKKDKIDQIDKSIYLTLRNLPFTYADWEDKELSIYKLPSNRLIISKFRGSELSEQEIEEFFQNSAATKAFLKAQTAEKLSESSARPLLPFNVGQLGLILTSGCLDGIIDEGDGCCHAVKGRVVKKNYVAETGRSSGEIQLTTTYANRVEINVFLPDGTYKSLA